MAAPGGGTQGSQPPLSPTLRCALASPEVLQRALAALRWKKAQRAAVQVSAAGLRVRCAESGALAGTAFFPATLFARFEYVGPVAGSTFDVPLGSLLDTLNFFSTATGGGAGGGGGGGGGGALTMRYPGVNDTLVLSMEDAAECLVTDAELPTLVEDGEDRWEGVAMTSEGETQAFAVDAGVLRDAVDDLEAVATVAKLALSNAPQRGPLATLSAEGHGSVRVELSGDAIRQWDVRAPCAHLYKVKFLKAATEHAQRGHGGNSAHGGVHHAGGGSHFGGDGPPPTPASALVKLKIDCEGTLSLQRFLTARADSGTFGSNVPFAFIEFILIPQEDLDDDL